ncbi:MAG: MATE family efflux transporter [Clostridia bacterium]|nr:MATE family efflux transporter [Clostridia bacterium]
MNKDLTVGKPSSVLWKFCLPLFGSIIFQQMYNIADSLVAGKFLGEDALAAVGNGYEITLIFIAFAFGCNIGCSVVVSRLFGSKQYKDLKTAVYTTLIASAVLCAVLMLAGLLLCRQLLQLINTPDNVIEDSERYLRIYIYSLPFVFFYNVATGIFSALGDSTTPFIFLAASSVANIGVDILFVTAIPMGVEGVAWATFLCQGISCILSIIIVFVKLRKIHTDEKPRAFSLQLFKEISVIAVPSILQQSFISVGNIIVQSVINSYGSSVMAGYSAAIKLNNLVTTSFTTLGNGISNYTSQNLGAGKPERLMPGFRTGVVLVWVICAVIVALYEGFASPLINFFISNPSEEAIQTGVMYLRIVSPFYFVVSVKLVADGVLRGAHMMGKFMIATFIDLGLRVVLCEIMSPLFGIIGIWATWPVGWTVGLIFSLVFCFKGIKKAQKAVAHK